MPNIFEIVGDIRALENLVESMTDEETGEVRDLTEEDKAAFLAWVGENEEALKSKTDGICKVYRNIRAIANVCTAEREALKENMDRLSKRAKARESEADRVKGLIWYALDVLRLQKIKTDLFSVGIQNTQWSVKTGSLFDVEKIPDAYINKDISITAIKEAVTRGDLYQKEGPENYGNLFYVDEDGLECKLEGIIYTQGKTCVIR
jgi:hypothetical protein